MSEFKIDVDEYRISPHKIVEFSRNFGENADIYKDYEPKDRETGEVGYDCE